MATFISVIVHTSALAGTSGVVSGKVTNATTGAALAGALVSATAPTGHYSATTNATGFYSMTGVGADTYTLTFSKDGYDPYTVAGINVFADQSASVDAPLKPSTKTIGKVISHGVSGGAYQPKQTVDTYTMTQTQINNIQGNPMNINESNLIVSLPGASLDSSGYPTIRGGRENEQGFQFEGIPYTDAFTNQFVNTLATPGLGLLSVQLTPGAGSAVFGNNGTGSLNLISRKGSYPAFSTAQFASGGGEYFHGLNLEFGTAAPDNHWSEYFAYAGQNTGFVYGNNAAPAAQLQDFLNTKMEVDREFVNNFVYRFGPNANRSLQLFYDDAMHQFIQGVGGNPFCFASCDIQYQDLVGGVSQILGGPGLSAGQIEAITALDPYQNSATQTLASANRAPGTYHQPNHAIKLQFDDNINSSTFFSAKYYHVNSVVTFDFPAWEEFGGSVLQGGSTNGLTADFTKQLGDKSLVKLGADFSYLHPTYNQPDPGYGVFSTQVGGGDPLTGLGAWEFLDFLPNDANCPFGIGACGYLQTYFPGKLPGKVPQNLEQSITNRQDFSLYIDEAYTFSSRFKVEPGLRMDGVNYRMPAPVVDPTTCTTLYVPKTWDTSGPGCPKATFSVTKDETQPRIVEPRIAMSYELGGNDALRFSYGRSVQFPPLGQVDLYVPPQAYAMFRNIPSFDALANVLGVPGQVALCGIPGFQVNCANYGDQLRWENQNTIEGVPLQPVKPELFDNYDFSYSHQFTNGFSLKLTPWYRRGYDGTASTQLPLLGPGGVPIRNPDGTYRFNPPVVTNKGSSHATGLEFLVTKDASTGLSGQFTATYINEYSNVIPLSASEDFFPSIPPASLLLGNLYRVGFLSPFQTSLDLNYQTKNGWRISPQFQYNIGYPNDAGLLTAAFINGNPFNIANTNFSGSINVAPNGTTQYVDPQDPGSFFNPHIAATRGTPESTWPGGKLSHPVTTANTTIEYNLAHNHLVGLTVTNLFNSIYSGPQLNSNYQPVATGLGGPLSGQHTLPFYPGLGQANYGSLVRGKNAYINIPGAIGRTYYIYFQQKM